MLLITDAVARELVTLPAAIAAVEDCFTSLAAGTADVFPVITCEGLDPADEWTIKSGRDRASAILGAKIGSYWPRNAKRGLVSHSSTVVLLSAQAGQVSAIVEASYLTCLRTAAADAVAVRSLARPDASRVAIIGGGHQAFYDLLAIAQVRQVGQVDIWSRSAENAERFAARAREAGFPARTSSIEAAVRGADIVVTATPSRRPLVSAGWVKPGTHISAMGSDAPGKCELDPELVAQGRFVADVREQSIAIGEAQEAVRLGLLGPGDIVSLGSVLSSEAPGRLSRDDITIFDSSGMALQDLAICNLALGLAVERGAAQQIA